MKTLLNLATPSSIYYSSKPLPQAKKNDVIKMSVNDINALMNKRRKISNFTWSMDFLVPDEWKLTDEDQGKINDLIKKAIPSDSFAVCFMDDKVGYGIFARKKILKGSIILYSGKIIPAQAKTTPYSLEVNKSLVVDALEMGNHAALFQDLFPSDIDSGAPIEGLPDIVARNNFIAKALTLSCGGFSYYEATEDVNLNMQCGMKYNFRYWNLSFIKDKKVEKVFFNKEGKTLTGPLVEFLKLKSLSVKQVEALVSNNSKANSLTQIIDSFIPNNNERFAAGIKSLVQSQPKPVNTTASISSNNIFTKKTPLPLQVLAKYNQDEKTADAAFRKATSEGNLDDMHIIYDNYKFDINARSSNKMTALHWAYKKDHVKAIEFILGKKEVDKTLVDKEGKTAEQYLSKVSSQYFLK